MANILIPDPLVSQLAGHVRPGESVEAAVARTLEEWLDLVDGRGQRGGALAVLLDEVPASARGEMAPPDRELLPTG